MIKWVVFTPAGDMVSLTPAATRQLAIASAVSIWQKPWKELLRDGFRCGRIETEIPELLWASVPIGGDDFEYIRTKAAEHKNDFTNFLSLVLANGIRMLREEQGDD